MNESPTNKPDEKPQEQPKLTSSKKVPKSLLLKVLGAVLVAGLLLGTGFWGYTQSTKAKESNNQLASLRIEKDELSTKVGNVEQELEKRKETTGESNLDKDSLQSVFLKNGQVYFGKITAITENTLTLEDIYYLKDNGGGDTSLVKLGNELHGPQDKMFIERLEITFWENLKNDSEVTKAIQEFKKQNP